jgi:hypothetical protein
VKTQKLSLFRVLEVFFKQLKFLASNSDFCNHTSSVPLGQHSTACDGKIEAMRTALRLLNLHQEKFERAVIFSDYKAALLSAGST